MQITAAIITEPGADFTITELELMPPQRGEALIKVSSCGVCHTDDAARSGFLTVPLPAVLGHEGCGVIEAVGDGVTGFSAGDHVCFSYGWCGECEACRNHKPYACESNHRLNFGGEQHDGTTRLSYNGMKVSTFFGQSAFAEYAVVHQNSLIHIPHDFDLSLAGPLGCGIQTGAGAVFNYICAQKDQPADKTSLLVTGCGAVGLSCIMAAKIVGFDKIIACDTLATRLDSAVSFGASHIIDAKNTADIPAAVRRITGAGAHFSVDCTGSGESVRKSLNSVRSGGICVILGATQDLTLNVESELMGKSKTLAGIVEGMSIPQEFIPKLIKYHSEGIFPFDKLITRYDFRDLNKAFADMKSGKVIKPVLVM